LAILLYFLRIFFFIFVFWRFIGDLIFGAVDNPVFFGASGRRARTDIFGTSATQKLAQI